jgi:hypothetical protein
MAVGCGARAKVAGAVVKKNGRSRAGGVPCSGVRENRVEGLAHPSLLPMVG